MTFLIKYHNNTYTRVVKSLREEYKILHVTNTTVAGICIMRRFYI